MCNLVAFAGFARSGKDAAATGLIDRGYTRVAFGDVIKKQVEPIVLKHLGFSAFTEDDEQKRTIRPILEQWGEVNYDGVMREFFSKLPEMAVNTRLVRAREGREWVKRGGVIIHVIRPGVGPATKWEKERLEELYANGLIHSKVINSGSIQDLVACVDEAVASAAIARN
jgi:hypothetical protein